MRHAIAIALAIVMISASLRIALAGGDETTLGLIADGPYRTGLAMRIARGVDHVGGLRVLPVIGKSPAQNLADLAELRGIDLALVPSDSLAFIKSQELKSGFADKIDYVVKLANIDIHIVANDSIHSLADLHGKRLAIGSATHASYETSITLIRAMKLDVTVLPLNGDGAIAAVKAGKADAAILVGVSPLPELARLKASDGLHLVAIHPQAALDDYYAPALLTPTQYPGLIEPSQSVESISSSLVLAAIRWPKGSPQQKRLQLFAEALFTSLMQSSEGAGINLNSDVAGWTRSEAASEALDSISTSAAGISTTSQEN